MIVNAYLPTRWDTPLPLTSSLCIVRPLAFVQFRMYLLDGPFQPHSDCSLYIIEKIKVDLMNVTNNDCKISLDAQTGITAQQLPRSFNNT